MINLLKRFISSIFKNKNPEQKKPKVIDNKPNDEIYPIF